MQHVVAGIGRTGTFCAVDIAMRRLGHAMESGNAAAATAAVDMHAIVAELRAARWGMVQMLEQYLFCYQARGKTALCVLQCMPTFETHRCLAWCACSHSE